MICPSDLTDKLWELVESRMPTKRKSGRPRKWGARQMFNAILYVSKTGCQWRQLPGAVSSLEKGLQHILALA